MSIYISGMDMPKSCSECFADNNGWCNILGCSIGDSVALRMVERRRDCPLVEVSPHGRLIDADALMDGWMNLREATKYGNETAEQQAHSYSTMMMYEIADEIDDAETIIPADPAEEDAE